MYKYDKVADQLVDDYSGKTVSPRSEGFRKAIAEYVLGRVAMGDSLNKIVPTESKIFPNYVEVVDLIEDPEFADLSKKAESLRARRVDENLVEAAERYLSAGTKDNLEALKMLAKVKDTINKKKDLNERITVVFNEFLPKDFWTADDD